MRPETTEPITRPRILLTGDPAARPSGLERALTRAGFQLVEREDPSVDPEAEAILITLKDIEAAPLGHLLPSSTGGRPIVPPHIVISSTPDKAGPATALSFGAADAMSAPIHLPELCARLHARIREKLEAARGAQWVELQDAAAAVMEQGLDPEELVLTLVRRLARSFDLAHCSFVSVAPSGESVRIIAEVQRPPLEPEHLELSQHPEIAEAIRTRRTVMTAVPASEAGDSPRTLVVVPIEGESRVTATLLLGTREAHRRLSPLQLEFAAGLARTAAAALDQNERVRPGSGHHADKPHEVPETEEALQSLDRRIREEFERARRYSLSFSIILLGIDELNGVRERLGGEAAERLKSDVAAVLRRELRLPDFVVEYGINEFAIVLPETGPTGARQSVLRVRERLAVVPSDGDPRLEHPRFSAGIVTYPHPAISQSDELYAVLEAALMRGKAQSGERIGVAV